MRQPPGSIPSLLGSSSCTGRQIYLPSSPLVLAPLRRAQTPPPGRLDIADLTSPPSGTMDIDGEAAAVAASRSNGTLELKVTRMMLDGSMARIGIQPTRPVMWKIYAQQLEEWESTVHRIPSNGYQQRRLPPKPAMFAFCLKPRERQLQIPSKGSKGPKQRSHKKLMYSGSHSFSREQDGFHRQVSGRRHGEYVGDGRTFESYDGGSLHSPTGYSPRFCTRTESPRSFDAPERGSTPRFIRTNSVKRNASIAFSEDHQASPSFRNHKIKRAGAPDHWNTVMHEYHNSKHVFPGPPQSHVEELKLRDATSAAQHAVAMARLKRERAHCLMHKADLAAHKASVALMIADAIKASSSGGSSWAVDGRGDPWDEER